MTPVTQVPGITGVDSGGEASKRPVLAPVEGSAGGMEGPRVTRLAPSPTGALHLGNARTFLINWALARRGGWRIVLRIEDLDGPRVKPEAITGTVKILEWLGIDWDEGPIVQSHDLSPYRAAMKELAGRGLVYPSEQTRAQIEEMASGEDAVASEAASAPQEGSREIVFPASLRPEICSRAFDREDVNWRLVVEPGEVSFVDAFAGPQRFEPARTIGDFVVWTKRGQPAYQLAVVVDDQRQGVTDVVRGDDLLESAARQLKVYRAMRIGPEPRYWHLPLVRGVDGKRLAKRHGDTRLDTYRARGVAAERVIGLVAWWSGVGERPAPLSARDFLDRLDPTTMSRMSREAVVFTSEDDAWLLGR